MRICTRVRSRGSTQKPLFWLPRQAARWQSGGESTRESHTESFDSQSQNSDAFSKLIDGNKLAGSMRDPYVAGAEYNRVGAKCDHARRFGAERYCARDVAGRLFKKPDQRRICARFETLIGAGGFDLADEIQIVSAQLIDCLFDQAQHAVGLLTGNRPPFECEAALARDDVWPCRLQSNQRSASCTADQNQH